MPHDVKDPNWMSNDEMTREIYKRIVGDGSDSNPGIDKRVDRLEAKMGIVFGGLALIGAALLTWIGNQIFSLFGFKNHP